MKITKAEESLMQMILSGEINDNEKMIGCYLAKKYPNGVFKRIMPRPTKRIKSVDNAPVLSFKFQEEINDDLYNLHLWFGAFTDLIQMGLMKAGKVGEPLYKCENNTFYAGEMQQERLTNDEWMSRGFDRFKSKLETLPRFLENTVQSKTRHATKVAQQRVNRQTAKSNNKQAVFSKHNTRSTPETELLYSVVSRLGDFKRISKAFGELLPLIKE